MRQARGEPLVHVLVGLVLMMFGPTLGQFIARYQGWIHVEEAGEHTFETASDGASFALVDGKPAVIYENMYGMVRFPSHTVVSYRLGPVRIEARRVFLGCTRFMDYLMSRPEWDGKNLIVTGSSQGAVPVTKAFLALAENRAL